MWALGYDGSRDELWDKLREKFTVTSIHNNNEVPDRIKLFSNYPNPFNPETNIVFIYHKMVILNSQSIILKVKK